MTIPGLYEWPDPLERTFDVSSNGSTFSCPVWQWGEEIAPAVCRGETDIADVSIVPSLARDFVGIAPNTPVDLIYPADHELVEDYVYADSFNPAPDWARVTYLIEVMEGPQSYQTTCETPNTEGGPRSGGCGGTMEPDIVETVETSSGVGSVSDGVVRPPGEFAYDGSAEGLELWPFGRLGQAELTVTYTGENQPSAATGFVRMRYRMAVWLYWEVEPEEPTVGNSTITIGTLVRGVRRRVVTPA